jgi:3'(2'), 5'-bisphosphate nucleotidase
MPKHIPRSIRNILPAALHASKKAGNAIIEIYESGFTVEHKIDHTPLTTADRRAHQIIMDHLSLSAGKQIPMVSEEGDAPSFEERILWEYFWLIDPLDGTKEFIDRNGEFTVNIALIHKNRPVFGIVHVPVLDLFYFGAEGLGSYKLTQSDILRDDRIQGTDTAEYMHELINASEELPLHEEIMPASDTVSPITVIGSRSHRSSETENFIQRLRKQYGEVGYIAAGSSLKFCLVAEGKADIYPRFGPTMEWDTAAGQVLVEQSGGQVLDTVTAEPLTYNKKDLINPHFIVLKQGITLQ